MAIKAEFKFMDNTLYVKATGKDDSVKDVLAYGQSVIEQALIHQAKQVLVDETELVYALGTFDLYETAKAFAESAPYVVKSALVVNPEQAKDAEFWETVAVNRGLFVRMFTSFDEAKQWLEHA
jgi:hypothetical protein